MSEQALRAAVEVELRRHLCYTSAEARARFWEQVDERLAKQRVRDDLMLHGAAFIERGQRIEPSAVCACGRELDAQGEHDGGYGAHCG